MIRRHFPCGIVDFITCLVLLLSANATARTGSTFEIVAHQVRVRILPVEKRISVVDTMRVRRLSRANTPLQFNVSLQHNIERVLVDGEDVTVERNRGGFLLNSAKLKEESEVVVWFSGEAGRNSDASRITSTRAVIREEEFLVRGAQNLQFLRATIVVPSEWKAVAVGKLISSETAAEFAQFTWVSTEPIPSVGWISAGKYTVLSNDTDSVLFSTYLFEEDSSLAHQLLGLAARVTRFYSQEFGPYRFPNLTIVEVENWLGGPAVLALATPSMILVKQGALTTADEFNKATAILPHEIAHQWWSQTIYVGGGDVAFLSEGMCEYSVRLYDESEGNLNPRSTWKNHPLLHSLIMRALRGKEVPLNRAADLRALPTHYLRAAYIHHMLRRTVGDDTFRQIYREFAHRYWLKSAGLGEFQKLAEELAGTPLAWFFGQWVKETGLPRLRLYNVKRVEESTGWVVQGRVRVVGYSSYTVPVSVGVITTTDSASASLWLGRDSTNIIRNDLPFEIRTPTKPLRVVVDPDGDLLKMQKMSAQLNDLREPSYGVMIVGTRKFSDRLLELARRDSAVMDQAGWSIRIKADTASTLSDYRSDRVFLYGGTDANTIASQLAKRFPVQCDSQRCSWKEKVYADTALAITQIIENPFQEQALLCWLVPLGEGATPILRPLRASAVVARRGETVESWTWEVKDEELEYEFKD